MIEYYFYISNVDGKPKAINRVRRDGSGLHLERWNGEEWVNHPPLAAYSGMGGDNDYYKTTEEEAMRFIEKSKGKK